MLTWAQQIAQAAQSDSTSSAGSRDQAQGRPSDPPADTLRAHEQPAQLSHTTAPSEGGQRTSAGDRDPFAFNLSKFSAGGSAGEEQGQETAPSQVKQAAASASSQADPFAFGMGVFGIASEPEPSSAADSHPAQPIPDLAAHAPVPEHAPAAAQDPYAFDMGAFGMSGVSALSAVAEAENSTLARAADGQSTDQNPGENIGPAKPATHADPYAFDVGAFGMTVDLSEQTGGRGTTAQQSAAQTSSAAAAEAQEAEKPASLADPFAFDMGAFGMATHPQEQAGNSSLQASAPKPQHISAAAQQDESIAGPSAQIDPYAFDMGAFGMSGMTTHDEKEQRCVGKSQSSAAPTDERGAKTAADPFAFEMGTFGMSTPDTTQESADSENTTVLGYQQRNAASLSIATTSTAEHRGQPHREDLAGMQQSLQQQRDHQHPQRKQANAPPLAAAGALALAPPEQDPFDPLTDAELQQLERLLLKAAGLDDSRSGNGESSLSANWLQAF